MAAMRISPGMSWFLFSSASAGDFEKGVARAAGAGQSIFSIHRKGRRKNHSWSLMGAFDF